MSKQTKKYYSLSVVFWIISSLLLITPMVTFGVIGIMAYQAAAAYKFLIACAVGAGVLTIADLIRHAKISSAIWLLLLGIVAVANIGTVLTAVSITTGCVILDEFVIMPLYRMFRNKFVINKEIDKRE